MRTSPGMALMAYRSRVPNTASSPTVCKPSAVGDSCSQDIPGAMLYRQTILVDVHGMSLLLDEA